MEMAAAATDEPERMKWLRIALAWQDIDRAPQTDRGKPLPQHTSPSPT